MITILIMRMHTNENGHDVDDHKMTILSILILMIILNDNASTDDATDKTIFSINFKEKEPHMGPRVARKGPPNLF